MNALNLTSTQGAWVAIGCCVVVAGCVAYLYLFGKGEG